MREIMVKPEVTEIKNIECALRVLSSAGKTVIWKNNCKEKNYYQHCFSNSHQLLNILGAKCGNCVRVCTNNLYFLISHLFCKPFQVLCCFSQMPSQHFRKHVINNWRVQLETETLLPRPRKSYLWAYLDLFVQGQLGVCNYIFLPFLCLPKAT